MPPAFGTANVMLDEFLDGPAPENPLSEDGKWAAYGLGYGGSLLRFPMRKINPGGITTSQEFAVNGSYWMQSSFIVDGDSVLDVFACTSGGQLGAALESWRISAWLGSPFSGTGYTWGFGGGIGKYFFMRRYDSAGFTGLHESGAGYPDAMGLRITSTTVEGWANFGDPFEPADWGLIHSNGDMNHRGAFYISLEAESQGCDDCVGFTCFGAAIINRTQFIRWTPGSKPYYRVPA